MTTNSINDKGCSVCQASKENYTTFRPTHRPKQLFYQYDYRHTDGELFSTVAPTLEECRRKRDEWLLNKWWETLSFEELENITGIENDRDGNNEIDALFIDETNEFWEQLSFDEKVEFFEKYEK